MSLATLLIPEGEFRMIRSQIADKLIQYRDGDAALLYLYLVQQGSSFDEQVAMQHLNFSRERFDRAASVLTECNPSPSQTATDNNGAPRYPISELRIARIEDHKFHAICDTAEGIVGRPLNDLLLRTLYMVYDHIALPAEVIIELLSYLKRDKGVLKSRDIEREAYLWSDRGILTTAEAQRYLTIADAQRPTRDALYQVFGIVGRVPTTTEHSLVALCLEKNFPPETLQLALQRMNRNIGQFSGSYLRKVLMTWDQKGVHTLSEVTALEPEFSKKQINYSQVIQPPFGASSITPPQQNNNSQLADWEKAWLEDFKRRRTELEEK